MTDVDDMLIGLNHWRSAWKIKIDD